MVLDPRWMGPPEIVAATLEAGPGPASTIANQLVWIVETISRELSMGLSAVNTAATATGWVGLGGSASAVNATSLNAGLQTMAGWTTHKVSVVQAALDAYACARPAVIPSLVCQTNRDEWTVLNATNLLGQNTPAIIERDLEYFGEHWPHNSSVGLAYSSALSALTAALAVPPPAPMGAAPAGVGAASAAAAVEPAEALGAPAQAAASAGETTSPLTSVLQQGPQLVSSATEPLNAVGQASGQAFQSVSAMPQALLGAFSSMRSTDAGAAEVAATEAVAEPVRASGGLAAGGGSVGGGYPGAALTSFTRPASTFAPEQGGRPVGRAGVLNAAELRGPTTTFPMGGAPVPAGMLGRTGDSASKDVARARIVVDER